MRACDQRVTASIRMPTDAPDGCVPHHGRVTTDALASVLGRGGVAVLSGAGLSTESGIPDYRGPSGAALRRHTPMTYQAFTGDAVARRRYWARSHVGWGFMSRAQPNDGHRSVADLESMGLVTGVITQNVDGLHSRAGSRVVVDLHGRLDRVVCLECSVVTSRLTVDERLREANRGWQGEAHTVNPDGDVDLPESALDAFTVVDCESCGGILKPDVVYFGENVPGDRVAAAYALVDEARSLLVLGSSLHVFSGRRFVMRAAQAGIPVLIVNEGPTRADDVASVKVEAPLGVTLRTVADALGDVVASRA
jgi:NAD-dependent SIR2 family protein deacetylase